MNRRTFIKRTSAVALTAPLMPSLIRNKRMGITIASYAIRWNSSIESARYPKFSDALAVLEHCAGHNAGGLQIGVSGWTSDFAGKVRDAREAKGLYLEGQIRLPWSDDDLPRFESEIQAGKEAGAEIFRAVCLGGRRYENFDTLASFQAFKANSIAALERAEAVVSRHRVKLAIENHKDWRVDEHIAIMEHLGSPWIGVTLDTGNNISLLEDPMAVVESLAPYTMTTHFKDMDLEPYEDGFLLAEVPLGKGRLDLAQIIATCEQHNPSVTFNLEMITRDPLKIPVFTEQYWTTFPNLPARDLAMTMQMAKDASRLKTLPNISHRPDLTKLAIEEANVIDSFAFAKEELGLTS